MFDKCRNLCIVSLLKFLHEQTQSTWFIDVDGITFLAGIHLTSKSRLSKDNLNSSLQRELLLLAIAHKHDTKLSTPLNSSGSGCGSNYFLLYVLMNVEVCLSRLEIEHSRTQLFEWCLWNDNFCAQNESINWIKKKRKS